MPSIQLTLLEIISLLAVLHCFVLSFTILFSKFFRSDHNRYLGLTLFIIALVGINNWFWDRNTSPTIINILDVFLWQFLYPVTLLHFFYKTSNYPPTKTLNIKYVYIPFITLSICNLVIYLSTVFNFYRLPEFISTYIAQFYRGVSLLSVVFPVFTIVLSLKLVLTQKNNPSNKWLKQLWVYFSLILLFGIGLEFYRFLFSKKLPLTYLWALISIFLCWLVYIGMYRFKLSNDRYEIRTLIKKAKNGIDDVINTKNKHFQKLMCLIAEEKIHHNPNLSRDDVAQQIGISNGYLSQIIRENTSGGLSDFINYHRIEDVKEMLKDSRFDDYSLLAIGLECGFNSKTSFFTNFKKETGLTPKEYQMQ